MVIQKQLQARLSDARVRGSIVLGSRQTIGGADLVDGGHAQSFRTAGLSVLRDLFGEKHQSYVDFEFCTQRTGYYSFNRAVQIIEFVAHEVAQGWLTNTRGLIAGEVFADFLDMAQHLSEQRYKVAAAVVAGSALEAHLRRLCVANGVHTEYTNSKGGVHPKAADAMNADLAKASVYDTTEQKQVTAWLGIRNDAAHGRYEKVQEDVVSSMVQTVRMFIQRCPA